MWGKSKEPDDVWVACPTLCGRGVFVGNVRVGRSGVLSADSDFLALDGVDARL